MAYVAVDKKDNREWIFRVKPIWKENERIVSVRLESLEHDVVPLPKGSIEKLIGKKLTWEDGPVELKEQK